MAAECRSHHHQILLHHHHQRELPQRPQPARGLRSTAGQIVEVQGGHIVRSTGRKDRHSKVCTAKGPRDRRMRLSANTAIQFYDVQDRLGYDRPSKAVDWLMKNAKAAIDELAELPAWQPTAAVVNNTDNQENRGAGGETRDGDVQRVVTKHGNSSKYHEFGDGRCGDGGGSSSFLPPSLDSDAIADTIKSFFPIAAAAASSSAPSSRSSPIGFQSYLPPDLLSQTCSQNQDLRLSLQSFQDPIFHHQQSTADQQQTQNQNVAASHHHSLFSGFDAASMVPWEVAESSSGGGRGGGGYVFSVPLQQQALAMHHGLSHEHAHGQSQQFFTQRGPLQSSNQPIVRAWADPMAAAADHQMHHYPAIHHPFGFASGGSTGFSGFRIPARIQGKEVENDGKPSSASSGFHH